MNFDKQFTYLTKKVSMARWIVIVTVATLVVSIIVLLGCASNKIPLQPTSTVPTSEDAQTPATRDVSITEDLLTPTGDQTATSNLDQPSPIPQEIIPSSGPTVTPLRDEAVFFIKQLPLWAPDIQWQDPEPVTNDISSSQGMFEMTRTGTGISPTNIFPPLHQKIDEKLTQMGWEQVDRGDAPNSASFTYRKIEQGKQWTIDINYGTKAAIISKADEEIRFAPCPCPYELTIILYSKSF